MTLVLNRSTLARVLDMGEVIEAVESAHCALASGAAAQPDRAAFELEGYDTLFVPMAAGNSYAGVAGVKFMTDRPTNPSIGRPRQQSAILLADAETGAPNALVDGALITQFRTAAASAVATRHLARQSGECLGLIGAGAQARSHLQAIKMVRPIRRVVFWTRTTSTASKFAEYARNMGVRVEALESPEAVVSQADILCTLTPSKTPIVKGEWFTPGMHINAVGAPPRIDHREIDTEGMRRSRIIVDSRSVARAESGDVMIPCENGDLGLRDFEVELGEVASGGKPGRTADSQITLYNSVGIAIQDIATAVLALEKAREKNLGNEIDLSS